jgi:hypothetical protein
MGRRERAVDGGEKGGRERERKKERKGGRRGEGQVGRGD